MVAHGGKTVAVPFMILLGLQTTQVSSKKLLSCVESSPQRAVVVSKPWKPWLLVNAHKIDPPNSKVPGAKRCPPCSTTEIKAKSPILKKQYQQFPDVS